MYFSGQHGVMRIATAGGGLATVGRLKNWSYTSQQQTLDTTSLQDTDKTIIPGVRSASGQASLLYYSEATSNVARVGSHLIKTGGTNYDSQNFGDNAQPELCQIELSIDGGGTIGFYAQITSFAMTCAVGEVVSADVSFEVHGAPYQWNF
jgi:hypothetical protein